jgi:hypothetical protein
MIANLALSNGGVYDNLGVKPLWRFGTIPRGFHELICSYLTVG